MLVGGPGNGLDSCRMVTELEQWTGGVLVPDIQLVVIATGGNLPVIWRPLKATHLSGQALSRHTLRCPHSWKNSRSQEDHGQLHRLGMQDMQHICEGNF